MNVILCTLLTLGVMGFAAGALLSYAAKRFSVPIDPRIEELVHVLPGANCGACGHASCLELAKVIIKGEAGVNSCVAGGQEVALKVAEIVGKSAEAPEEIPEVAVVRCRGGQGLAKDRFKYTGIPDCRAALLIAGGPKACIYGCIGLGSCVKICPFGAITTGPDGLPVIDENKCTACGKCVEVCPRDIIELIPRDQKVYLACVSRDKTRKVRDVCKVGCITCGICVKPDVTPEGLITMADNLPEIHWEEGKDLRSLLAQTVGKCPNKCFVVRE